MGMEQEDRESAFSRIEALLSVKSSSGKGNGRGGKFEELQSLLSPEQSLLRDIKRQIGGTFSGQNLVLCDPSNTKDAMSALMKLALENGKVPVLVLTGMNYKVALGMIAAAKVSENKVFIVDTVSKSIIKTKETDRIFFVDSLRNLTQMEITVFKLIEKDLNSCFIFDSIDVLQLYHDDKVIGKFAYSLTKLLHRHKRAGFYLLNRKSLLSKLNQFADSAVELKRI